MNTSLGALRERLLNFRAWDSTGSSLNKRIREAMNTALDRLAGDVPEALIPDEEHIVLLPDYVGSDATVAARLRATTDSRVLEFTTAADAVLGASPIWSPTVDGTWDGIMHLEIKDPEGVWHRRQSREFFTTGSGGSTTYYVSIDRRWPNNSDTLMDFRIHQPEFFFTDDVMEVLEPARVWDSTRQQVWSIDTAGASRQDMVDFQGNSTGRPYRFWRGRHYQVPTPRRRPEAQIDARTNAWVGPEQTGKFRFCYTIVWGRKDPEWQYSPGGVLDPQFESAPSPESAQLTLTSSPAATQTTTVGSGVIELRAENIDYMTDFDIASALRETRSGYRIRFYVARDSFDAGQPAGFAADNIVEFGTDPKNYRDLKATLKNIDGLRSRIAAQAEEEGYDESVVDGLLSAVVGQSEEPHLRGFQKHRYELDENFETTIDGVAVHIDDLFNRDIAAVTSAYAHQVFGATEMRKALKALARETGDSSWENVGVNTFAAQAAKGIDNTADREYAEKAFEMAYRRVSGMKLWEASEGTLKFVIGTQSFAQGVYGQALGIAQLPEIASNLVRPGFRNSMTALPAIKDIANIFLMGLRGEGPLRGESGRLLDNVAAELETFVGCGGDYIRGEHVLRRLDDMGIDKGSTSIFGKALDMGRSVALLNPLGVIPMDTFLRRWGTKAYFQKFVNEAYRMKEGKPVLQQSFWNNGKQRFMELGLSEQEATRIFKALARDDVVTVKKGLFGNYKVMDIDFDKIEDQHAYDMLALAIRKGVDMSVQRQSLGEMPLWMNKGPVVKMFTQYRVFMMASRGKQVAAGIARADAKEAANLIGSIGLGALGYTLLTYGRSFSRPEEERAAYFEEQLSSSNMLKSGIMRSSYSSIFPMLIDSGFSWAGHTAPFGASKRTTGFGTGVFDGTVPGGVLKQVLGVSGEIGANMFSEDEWTTKDIRDITRLLWFTRVPVVSQAMDSLVSNYTGLPDRD